MQLELYLHDQLDSQLATCFLTFIAIPTPFLNFIILFISSTYFVDSLLRDTFLIGFVCSFYTLIHMKISGMGTPMF